MAQPEKSMWVRVVRAVDERWWLRHGLFWLVDVSWFTWFFIFQLHMTDDWRDTIRATALLLPLRMVVVYSLLYGVLPRLWRDANRKRFLVLLAAWFWLGLALNFAYRAWVLLPSHQGVASSFDDYNIVFATGSQMPLLLTSGLAVCLRLYRQWRLKGLDNTRLAQENAQAELQLLRAQVHPHFLFNTLNNLYALTLRQSAEAPAVVERLTGLLHFVVAQGSAPLVALTDEVALLRNYMALEQLRYGPRLTLEFQAPGMPAAARIAPLLLLPLVENAFKHGSAEQLGQACIRVLLAVEGSTFHCLIENTRSADLPDSATPAGIGLRNVHQRLQLLYPRLHHLAIEARSNTFTVRLRLELSKATAASPGTRPRPLPEALPANEAGGVPIMAGPAGSLAT